MNLEISKILDVCNELKISFEEMFFCLLLIQDRNADIDVIKLNKSFKEYYDNNKVIYNYKKRVVDLLVEAKLINNFNVSDELVELHNLVPTQKAYNIFFNGSYLTAEKAWDDLIKAYPRYMLVNGKKISARNISSPKVKEYYFKEVIKGLNIKHQEVISLTLHKFGSQWDDPHVCDSSALAQCGLEKYIYSWDTIKDEILDSMSNNIDRISKPLEF